jgi:hypothetical protein
MYVFAPYCFFAYTSIFLPAATAVAANAVGVIGLAAAEY